MPRNHAIDIASTTPFHSWPLEEDSRHDAGTERFLNDVVYALEEVPRQLPARYSYDPRGVELLERASESEEYYLQRAEREIFVTYAADIAKFIGPHATVIDMGRVSTSLMPLILPYLERPEGYVPLDIAADPLWTSSAKVQRDFPEIKVMPSLFDFSEMETLPIHVKSNASLTFHFSGTTFGSLDPKDAIALLARLATMAPGSQILVSLDLKKDPGQLAAAYNDRLGYMAAFNRNLLTTINRELGANFDLDAFQHVAFYNKFQGRVEMHLESLSEQTIDIADSYTLQLHRGECIHTQSAYKYSIAEFRELADTAGYSPIKLWTDEASKFSLQLLNCFHF